MPDLSLERQASGVVAGIDEAGRGPWAGPVVAAAVILEVDAMPAELMAGIDDSKVLTRARRNALYRALVGPACQPVLPSSVALRRTGRGGGAAAAEDGSRAARRPARIGLGAASVAEIGRLNILGAALTAMARALTRLGVVPDLALVDGNQAPALPCPVKTVVGGDRLSLSIAAASIVAKVTRDRIMAALAERHPGFGWEHNAGYGTAEHRAALARLGVTPHHRRSFAPVRERLSSRY